MFNILIYVQFFVSWWQKAQIYKFMIILEFLLWAFIIIIMALDAYLVILLIYPLFINEITK